MPTSEPVLQLDQVGFGYGSLTAVSDVSLSVSSRTIVALLGANGAGKSSLFRGISGAIRLRRGQVRYLGRELSRESTFKRARSGLVHVPEGRGMIAPLTVSDNLALAGLSRGTSKRDFADRVAEVYEFFPRLHERSDQLSGLLSGGEQQMLALGRAMVMAPKLLLLDEPSMGLAPIMIEEVYRCLSVRPQCLADTAILLAEQSARVALEVADQVHVLSGGVVVASGTPAEISAGATLEKAYLGKWDD